MTYPPDKQLFETYVSSARMSRFGDPTVALFKVLGLKLQATNIKGWAQRSEDRGDFLQAWRLQQALHCI
ncbi:hypothetical protein ACIQSO_03270 [Pseudomonas putida]|uniref:hypothetical protein n=1 Tax=Pseudomonas putida TaxID=303 RepID=UPI00383A9839